MAASPPAARGVDPTGNNSLPRESGSLSASDRLNANRERVAQDSQRLGNEPGSTLADEALEDGPPQVDGFRDPNNRRVEVRATCEERLGRSLGLEEVDERAAEVGQ